MAIRTHSLFHLTEEFTSLQNILRTGAFWPHYSLEDLSWISGKPFYVGFPIVSFCDIPISRIEEHTAFYGEYGIGLTQEWGKGAGLNPLLYINEKSAFSRELHQAAVTVMEQGDAAEKKKKAPASAGTETVGSKEEGKEPPEKDWSNLYKALHLMAYTKPMVGTMRRQNKNETKNFYGESEWRYIPSSVLNTPLCNINEETFGDLEALRKANEAVVERGPLAFSIDDIRYLFVKTISEVPFLVDFINSHLGHYPANQLKILVSRIFSLEDLRYDI